MKRVVLLFGGFLMFLVCASGLFSQEVKASTDLKDAVLELPNFSEENEGLIDLKNESSVQPNAELLKYWFSTEKHVQPSPAPPIIYYTASIYGTSMGGYLSLVGRVYGNWYQYEGYLYNLKYPIPAPTEIKEEEM